MIQDIDYSVDVEEDKAPVTYEIKLKIVDVDGYYNGLMTLPDLVRNLEDPMIDAIGARQ